MFRLIPQEQRVSDAVLTRISENVVKMILQVRRKPARQPLVYHYTNGPGLIGIANSKALWATHIGFMNDTNEYREAIRMLRDAAEPRLEFGKYPYCVEQALRMIIQNTETITADQYFPWFVTCFSECADDLAQWRGYSAGETKFALAFELNHLQALVHNHSQSDAEGKFQYRMYLAPVVYDDKEKQAIWRLALDFIGEQLPKDVTEAKPADEHAYIGHWLDHFASFASMITPAMKDKAFEQEREWRIIAMPIYNTVKYRSRRTLLTPYIDITLMGTEYVNDGKGWDHPVRECWIGPSPHMDSNRFAARNLLGSAQFGGTEMKMSAVPYRDL